MTIQSLSLKKIYFILFGSLLLLFGLGLGQANFAAAACNPPSIPTPSNPADITYAGCTAGQCGSLGYCGCDVTSTKGYLCMDEAAGTDCKPSLCPGVATNKCCKPKAGSGATCSNCKAKTSDCTGTLVADPANNAACTDTTKPVCCKVKTTPGTGGTQPPAGPTTTGGASYDLSALSPVGNIDVPTLIGLIIKGALGIVGSIALLMFVYGGFLLLVSQGDSAKIQKGKATMVWAAAGLAVIFGSYIFVSYIIAGLSVGGGSGTGTPATPKADCPTAHPGYSCIDSTNNKTGCIAGLCPGAANIKCCPGN